MAEGIIVTGATGFIGESLVAELVRRNYHVHAFSRRPVLNFRPDLTFHTIDLHDQIATANLLNNIRAATLIHAAWYTAPRLYWESERNLDWISSSLHLFKHFGKSGGSRIVGVGSCAEYEWNKGFYLENDATHQPATLYGTSKMSLHQVASKFCHNERISFSWARLFFLYGPNEQHGRLLPSLIDHIKNRSPLQIRDRDCTRDFMHVTEAAGAIASLTLSEVEGPVNICSGIGTTVGAFVEAVFDAAGLACTASFDSGPNLLSPLSLVGSNERLKNEVGWKPIRDFKSLLHETVVSYLE